MKIDSRHAHVKSLVGTVRIVAKIGLEEARVPCLSKTLLFDVKIPDVATSSYKMFRVSFRDTAKGRLETSSCEYNGGANLANQREVADQ